MKRCKYRGALIPSLLLCVIAAATLAAHGGFIPQPADTVVTLARKLGSATPQFIAACAFIENLVAVNAYFPGAFVILFAMASTHGKLQSAFLVFAVIATASGSAQHLNFFAGRWLRRRMGEQALHVSFMGGLANYWHPQLGAVYSFRAGVSGATYRQFGRALAAFVMWTCFWGILMYQLGAVPISGGSFVTIFVVYLSGWLAIEVVKSTNSPPS